MYRIRSLWMHVRGNYISQTSSENCDNPVSSQIWLPVLFGAVNNHNTLGTEMTDLQLSGHLQWMPIGQKSEGRGIH